MLRIRKYILCLVCVVVCFLNSYNVSKGSDLLQKTDNLYNNNYNKEYRYITMHSTNEIGWHYNNNKWELCYGSGILSNFFDNFTTDTTQKIKSCCKIFNNLLSNNFTLTNFYYFLYFRNLFANVMNMLFKDEIEYLLGRKGKWKFLYQYNFVIFSYTYSKENINPISDIKKNILELKADETIGASIQEPQCIVCSKNVYKRKCEASETLKSIQKKYDKGSNNNDNAAKVTNRTDTSACMGKLLKNGDGSYILGNDCCQLTCCNSYAHGKCLSNSCHRINCIECGLPLNINNNNNYTMFFNLKMFKRTLTLEYSDINKSFFIMPFFRFSGIFEPSIYMHPFFFFYKNIPFNDIINTFKNFLIIFNLAVKIEIGFSYLNKHFFSFYIKPNYSIGKQLLIGKGDNNWSINFGIEYFLNGKGSSTKI